jgi:hypothetical protein
MATVLGVKLGPGCRPVSRRVLEVIEKAAVKELRLSTGMAEIIEHPQARGYIQSFSQGLLGGRTGKSCRNTPFL